MEIELHQNRLDVRVDEVIGLIDDMHEEDFLQTRLGFSSHARLDMSKLIVGGHSFGGITAIAVAERDKRVRACATLDPWYWAKNELIDSGNFSLSCEQIHIVTESFEPGIKNLFHYSTLEKSEVMMD